MKIVAFIGREHHALKMGNALRLLNERGHEVIYLCAENATNQDPASEFIRNYTVNWRHAYDYLDVRTSAAEIDAIVNDARHFSANQQLLKYTSPFWISFSIREAATCIVAFRNMIATENPDAVICLHGANYWARMLFYLAQDAGIKTFAFQEGLLRQRDQETMGKQASSAKFVDTLFTWSESDKQAYLSAGVDESVIRPVGPSHLDYAIQVRNSPDWEQGKAGLKRRFGYPQGKIISFMPPLSSHYKGDLRQDIAVLQDYANQRGEHLYVRLHPFEYRLRDYLQKAMPAVRFDKGADSVPLLLSSDAVITQHSTIGIEALFLGIPLFEIDMANTGIEQSLEPMGVPVIRTNGLSLLHEYEGYNQELKDWISNSFSLADGRSTERIANIVESEVGNE